MANCIAFVLCETPPLDAKTQVVASFALREPVGRANVACDAGENGTIEEHAKVSN